jgi:hypothetical protein
MTSRGPLGFEQHHEEVFMSFDEFADQESGGGITDFTITVTNAFFEIDPNYSAATGSDTYFLHWEGTTDVEGHEQMTRDGFHPKWALDPDFMSMDGGKTVVSQSGKGKLGKAVGRMMGAASNALRDAGLKDSPESPFNKPGASPRDASVWIGTTWYLTEVTREFGNGMKATDQLPTKYITTGAPAPAAAPAAAPAPAAPADNALRAAVIEVANAAANHGEFVSKAMAIPGVSADSQLTQEIVNPTGIYVTKA